VPIFSSLPFYCISRCLLWFDSTLPCLMLVSFFHIWPQFECQIKRNQLFETSALCGFCLPQFIWFIARKSHENGAYSICASKAFSNFLAFHLLDMLIHSLIFVPTFLWGESRKQQHQEELMWVKINSNVSFPGSTPRHDQVRSEM